MPTPNGSLFLVALHGCLVLSLLVATVTDLRQRRIPNLVTLPLILLALLLHSLATGLPGLVHSLQGLGLGFGLLLIPHLLGGIGAGDVKLMAAVGAVLGPAQTFAAFLVIAILGGVVSVATMAVRGELLATLARLGHGFLALFGGAGLAALRVDRTTLRRQGIPYGVVIAAGTVAYLAYEALGGRLMPIAPV